MSTEHLNELLALPLPERVELAQALWQSIDQTPDLDSGQEEREAAALARRRDAELSSGAVSGRTHEQVMEAARRALGCG
jgi:putative addiction module component (TIGR02574 family)